MFRKYKPLAFLVNPAAVAGIFWVVVCAEAQTLSRRNPWDLNMNWQTLNEGYDAIEKAIQENAGPGAVVVIAKDGAIVRRRAFGYAQLYTKRTLDEKGEPVYGGTKRRMTVDTLFDLASLTKMVATNTSIQILLEEGKIRLDAPVADYMPEFGGEAKQEVTLKHLLTHTSGLPAWANFYQTCRNESEVWQGICQTELEAPPGYQRVYSDLGFITLGKLVERISGQRLDHFAAERIFRPLGMKDTGFNPPRSKWLCCAATEWSDTLERFLCGQVHDENAFVMGGVSGHAGLFSTVDDLSIFCQMLLNRGIYNGIRILSEETVKQMLTPQVESEVLARGSGFLLEREQLLGWWAIGSKMEITSVGGLPSPAAFGHTGFTGTSIWIDPEHQAFAILLTNAVHPSRTLAQRSKFRDGFYQAVWDTLLGETQSTR